MTRPRIHGLGAVIADDHDLIGQALRVVIKGESNLSEEILRKLLIYVLRYPARQLVTRETSITLAESEATIREIGAQRAGNKLIAR